MGDEGTCPTCGKPAHRRHFLGACGPVDTWPNRIDTNGIRQRFVDETRQKFANAGYDLSPEEVDILVTKLPCSLYEALFSRVLQPMRGSNIYAEQAKYIEVLELREETCREVHQQDIAANQRLRKLAYKDENLDCFFEGSETWKQAYEDLAEELEEFKSHHQGGGCGIGKGSAV